jgi:hypothetical protein
VLCSVDVAVIIFGRFNNFYPDDPDSIFIVAEERPGHHVKLYQYGSADIHDIVQRHLRVSRLHFFSLLAPAHVHRQHDGEKDTRGPQDFSGSANAKLDDIGDVDDDDQDDDDDLPSRSLKKRGLDGKLKPTQDLTNVRGVTARFLLIFTFISSRWTTVLVIVLPSLSRYPCMLWLLLRVEAVLPYLYPV